MPVNKQKISKFYLVRVLSIWFLTFSAWPIFAQSSLLDLNTQIQEKKQGQKELQKKITAYGEKIRATQKKAASLANQINILEANINKTELEIVTKALEAEQLALEVQLVEGQIQEEKTRQTKTRFDLAEILQQLRVFEERRPVQVLAFKTSLSLILEELVQTERLAQGLSQRLQTIQAIQRILVDNQVLLEGKKQEAELKRQELDVLQISFEQEKRVKEALFGKTKATEAEFRVLLNELRAAASAIDSEIVTLEHNVREKLDLTDKLAGDTRQLSWPILPRGGLSALFHDPEYPYRYLFEHGGVDIRTPQGTPVAASASGYVAKVFNGGMGIKPSYVMLLHNNKLSTVYMHLAAITVAPDTFVARGDIIGRSGGTPRTPGAGRWTTGPHLHFETRINGVPVDPLSYLP